MKWYQHQSNSRNDLKVKALVRKHGVEGYGVYHLVNEILSEKIEENPDCILEHDEELLAVEANIPHERLAGILDTCVHLKLFTMVGDKYQNLKVAKYCDNWTKRNKPLQSKAKELQRNSVVSTEPLQRHSVQNRIEYNKSKQIKLEQTKEDKTKAKTFNQKRFNQISKRIEEIDFALPNCLSDDMENELKAERAKLYKELDDMNPNPIEV